MNLAVNLFAVNGTCSLVSKRRTVMNRFDRLITATSLSLVSLSATAGIGGSTGLDAPPSLVWIGLGLVLAVLIARNIKR